jgi:hypothetical protein
VSGVVQGPPVVPLRFPGERERLVGVCLFGGVVVAYGQVEGPVQVPDGLRVQAQPGTGLAEEPVGAAAGGGVGQVG